MSRLVSCHPEDNDWKPYLRSLTLTKLDRPTEAQTDLQTAIALSQATQAEDPIDWQNNFNLALYYLAAGRFDESCGLYDSRSGRLCQRASEASRDSMVSDRPKVIEDAIRDLDDYLVLFPDQVQARAILGELSIKKGNRPRYNKSIISSSSS